MKKTIREGLKNILAYYYPAFFVIAIAVAISFLTRLALLVRSASGIDWSFPNIAGLFGIGLLYDFFVALYFALPIVLHLWWLNDRMYSKNIRRWLILLQVSLVLVLILTQLVPKDFNEDLRKFVIGYFIVRLVIFILFSFMSERFRLRWRKTVLLTDIILIVFILLFNAVSEWFFWEEFTVRYNFIAVDYLVYTTEVIGNIKESYPVAWIVGFVALLSIITVFAFRLKLTKGFVSRPAFLQRSYVAILFLIVVISGFLFLDSSLRHFSKNEYVNELAGNGLFEFGTAFNNNELDFYGFYQTLPDKEAFTILRKELSSPVSRFTDSNLFNVEREISYNEPEKKMNVVLISIESLSASFMNEFGSNSNITPHLDSLVRQSLFFTNLYATGTRTVRGLEALSLSIPPTPGQSIVKRPSNDNLFTIGSVFQSKGYKTQYIYGGYGYFDNMKRFFGNNGYEVIDRTGLEKEQIHYSNIWGVADEDLFTLALQAMDKDYASHQPFFSHVMTVSNHRPFTYPDGRIDIPSEKQVRDGAVKYTDYAVDKFLREAKQKPWFSNTLFIIVADHCAGSAGSVELPVTGYHIPLLIYSPGNIAPQRINRMMSQIDIAPTILGLLKFNYRSKFFGQDIFALPGGRERAFISTYQGLGYLKNNKLIIQSPIRKIREYTPDFKTGASKDVNTEENLRKEAIAYYQCASWLLKHGKYGR
jgi:phosphoglycerol transferase MdoB-like AlkP superfamily enzyme